MVAGRRSAKAALDTFLDTFGGGGEVEGKITRKEFFAYFTNLSAGVDNDAYFDLLLRGVWGLEKVPRAGACSDSKYSSLWVGLPGSARHSLTSRRANPSLPRR